MVEVEESWNYSPGGQPWIPESHILVPFQLQSMPLNAFECVCISGIYIQMHNLSIWQSWHKIYHINMCVHACLCIWIHTNEIYMYLNVLPTPVNTNVVWYMHMNTFVIILYVFAGSIMHVNIWKMDCVCIYMHIQGPTHVNTYAMEGYVFKCILEMSKYIIIQYQMDIDPP